MEKAENFYYNGKIDTLGKLKELIGKKYENIVIEEAVLLEQFEFTDIRCDSLEIKSCVFKNEFSLKRSNVDFLKISKCTFEVSLSLGKDLVAKFITLKHLTVSNACILYYFKILSVNDVKANAFLVDYLDQENTDRPDILKIDFQNSSFDIVQIIQSRINCIIGISNNRINTFCYEKSGLTNMTIGRGGVYEVINLKEIEELNLDGIYDLNCENFILEHCKISYRDQYRESVDSTIVKDKKIDNLIWRNCTFVGKSEFAITHPMYIDLRECKFEEPFVLRSVYQQNHIVSSRIALLGENSGDILIEHCNLDLKLIGTNFSNITVKGSGINALTFETFSNHGKINFINSKSSVKEYLKDKKYTNHLTAYDSILDNINFHFFDLNSFSQIQFINTNILGMQLFHYPERLVNYLDNLSMLPCIENERDFNINAKFTYNQLRLLAERNGDTDKSVEYRSREQNYLRRTKDNVGDELLLFLNELSNWHGRNWLLGVFFTLIAGLISFAGYQGSLGIFLFCDSNWSADYIRYIATYPKLQLDNYQAQGTVLTDLARIFGIIFMGYGVFQTIAAFRKYGKK